MFFLCRQARIALLAVIRERLLYFRDLGLAPDKRCERSEKIVTRRVDGIRVLWYVRRRRWNDGGLSEENLNVPHEVGRYVIERASCSIEPVDRANVELQACRRRDVVNSHR